MNVTTTNGSADSTRPECATAIICKELEKGGINICALGEVRHPGSGNVIERSHTIFWNDNEKKEAEQTSCTWWNESDTDQQQTHDSALTTRKWFTFNTYQCLWTHNANITGRERTIL